MKILFSNVNFANTAYGLRPPEWLGEFAAEAGYDGVEVHPIWFSAESFAGAALKGRLNIQALHQSFSEGRWRMQGVNNDPAKASIADRIVNSPLVRPMTPSMEDSADFIRETQKIIGEQLPAIFHPQITRDTDKTIIAAANPKAAYFQPTDHVAKIFRAGSVSAMMSEAWMRGYDGLCLDTFHAQRRYGAEKPGVVSSLGKSLGELAVNTRAVHFSLARSDIGGEDIDVKTDLNAALNGITVGQTREILQEVAFWSRSTLDYAAVQLSAGALAYATKHRRAKDLQSYYGQIADTLREALS